MARREIQVLYNAVQPPLTALLGLVVTSSHVSYGPGQLIGTLLVMVAVWTSARGGPVLQRVLSCMRCSKHDKECTMSPHMPDSAIDCPH